MAKGEVIIDYRICMGCGVCVQACPFSYLELARYGSAPYKRLYPALEDDIGCTGCGICAQSCPLECITARKKDEKKEAPV